MTRSKIMSTGSNAFLSREGRFGPRAVLTSDWSPELEAVLTRQFVAEIELNRGKGWHGQDLTFLDKFPDLLGLSIIGRTAGSVASVHTLHKLRSLTILTYCKTELRFNEFPDLIDCSIEWRPKAVSMFDCVSLQKLFVKGYRGKDAIPFGRLINLESLAILGSPIKDLRGLATLSRLKYLRLGDMRKLENLDGIEALSQLETLDMNTCRKVTSISELEHLSRLRELHLTNMGQIETLKPIQHLPRLESVSFVESTNILDGDLSPLVGRANLANVSFQNRRHYSHTREEFGSA